MEPSFQQQLSFYAPRVHRAALGFLCDEQEAREVAQDALLRAWQARERYDQHRPFYPWLYTIVKNACRDSRDRRRHRPRASVDTERLVDAGIGPLARLDALQARVRVRRALLELDPDQREIINLRHFQDLAYGEIAATLGIPVGTVMSRLFRARRALLARLGEIE